jgi:F0F1-type ATP synthase beta subunit
MTQNFTVVESQTEKKGVQVALKDTIADIKAILTGVVDHLKPEDMSFIGTLKEIDEKVKAKPVKKEEGTAETQPAPAAAP